MKRKYKIQLGFVLVILVTSVLVTSKLKNLKLSKGILVEDGIKLVAKTQDTQIQMVSEKIWKDSFLKGVNMGTAKPGYYPGEFGITKKEYLRWFKQISDMNANVIRVYTLQMPDFYEALYEYNLKAKSPLYLIQGVWLDEETMLEEMDAFSPAVYNRFEDEVLKVIDVLHGNKRVEKVRGVAYGQYKKDVSPYVLAYILGTEWDPYFVEATNKKHEKMVDFEGKYISTEAAQPMEIFFAKILETGIAYESETYEMQKPMAITNWLTTDSISHDYDVEEANRIGNIDVTHIQAKPSYLAGLFASYHVYPYYPDFLNYESPYVEANETGTVNSYRAYLEDLKSRYTIPVVVSEFGVPTSRGISHKSITNDFNQGLVDETEQGEMLETMIQDIYETDCAGAVIFSWQDEWFKRTWNTMNFDDPEGRAYWLDQLTNEQKFGLLAFDPGEKETVAIDGELKEWKKAQIVSQNERGTLWMQSDEAYVYFAIAYKDLDWSQEKIWIPINVSPYSGAKVYEETSIRFDQDVDFMIQIEDVQTVQIVAQDYYDATRYLEEGFRSQASDSNHFEVITQTIARKATLPLSGQSIPYQKVTIGQLNEGYSSPRHENYTSLADFKAYGNQIEIRIPWLMLNVSNPAKKLILGDFQRTGSFNFEEIESMSASVYLIHGEQVESMPFGEYQWEKWDLPTYHERLKPAYEVVKKAFANLR